MRQKWVNVALLLAVCTVLPARVAAQDDRSVTESRLFSADHGGDRAQRDDVSYKCGDCRFWRLNSILRPGASAAWTCIRQLIGIGEIATAPIPDR